MDAPQERPDDSNLTDALERVASDMFTDAADKRNPDWQPVPDAPVEPANLVCDACGESFTEHPEMRISNVLRCAACWQKIEAIRTAAEQKGFKLGI